MQLSAQRSGSNRRTGRYPQIFATFFGTKILEVPSSNVSQRDALSDELGIDFSLEEEVVDDTLVQQPSKSRRTSKYGPYFVFTDSNLQEMRKSLQKKRVRL